MFSSKTYSLISLVCLWLVTLTLTAAAQQKKRINLAFFEAGRCLEHDILRDEFSHQLQQLTPDGFEILPIPQGYKSAEWKRDSCRLLATELVALEEADMVVALGPWVVEDLLAAGYDKPIVVLNRVDPMAEGLLDKTGRPIAPNLTVQARPIQLARDIDALTRLINVRRLGVLYFPTGDEQNEITAKLQSLGEQHGFEVLMAEGYDNKGAYAFFKAYQKLAGKVDAVYLFPMWAMDGIKIREFFSMTNRDKMPTFVWEGAYLVQRGALAGNSGFSVIPQARMAAVKLLKIIEGATPADLPVVFDVPPGLSINEATAAQCGVTIPTTLQREVRIVRAPPSEDSRYFSFNDALHQAIDANPSHLARYDVLEASAQAAKQAYGTYLPHLYGRFSITHFDGSNTIASDGYESGIDLDQTVFSLEAIRAIQAAAQRRGIEQINLRQSQLDLELAVTLAYLNYLQVRDALGLYQEDRNRVSRFLELAFTRREVEGNPGRDVTRWEQNRHEADARVVRGDNDLVAAGVLLNSLFNLPGHSELTLDTAAFAEPNLVRDYRRLFPRYDNQKVQEQVSELLVSEALTNNPTVGVHRARITLQEKLLAQNRARFFPTLGLRASYYYTDVNWDQDVGLPEYYDRWWARAEIRLPLFQGADRFREHSKQKALLSREEYSRDDASLRVMHEVLTRWDELVTLGASLPSYVRAGELSLTELQSLIGDYESGRMPLIDLVDAQRNTLQARLTAIDARYRFYRSLVRLTHALGWSASDRNRMPGDLFFDGVARLAEDGE